MFRLVKSYKLVIFDWDGTLSDSCELIVAAVKAAEKELGLPEVDREKIRAGIGLSYEDQVANLYGQSIALSEFRFAFEKAYYSSLKNPEPPLFRDVEQVLKDIKNKGGKIAIATGKSRRGLDESLKFYHLSEYFDYTVCSGEARSKPDPSMLEIILDQLDFLAVEAVMIGDTLNDCLAARSASVDFIAVASAGRDMAMELERQKPVMMINEVSELLEIHNFIQAQKT